MKPSPASEGDPAASIAQVVRAHDRDRYLATLFAPEPARQALMALYAFDADVARVPERVSEPMLGEIRLQWWRDALETLDRGGVTGNPVADSLGEAMRRCALPKPLLLSLVDARAFDLSGEAMPDGPALKAYLQKTAGTPFAIAGRIIAGGRIDSALERVAAQAGFAWGLTRLLRLLPLHLSRGRLYLPVSQFRDHGADPERLYRGEADETARAALAGLRDEAREAFAAARSGVAGCGRAAAVAFLPCALVPAYLAALDKQAQAPLRAVADIGPLARITRLGWAAMRGRL